MDTYLPGGVNFGDAVIGIVLMLISVGASAWLARRVQRRRHDEPDDEIEGRAEDSRDSRIEAGLGAEVKVFDLGAGFSVKINGLRSNRTKRRRRGEPRHNRASKECTTELGSKPYENPAPTLEAEETDTVEHDGDVNDDDSGRDPDDNDGHSGNDAVAGPIASHEIGDPAGNEQLGHDADVVQIDRDEQLEQNLIRDLEDLHRTYTEHEVAVFYNAMTDEELGIMADDDIASKHYDAVTHEDLPSPERDDDSDVA